MNKKMKYIWTVVALVVSIMYGCNKDDILLDNEDIAPVPLKMELKNDVIISGDSLEVIFQVDDENGTVANQDMIINLSLTDDTGADLSEFLLGFTKIITFPRGEKTLIKKFQVCKLQMPLMNVNLSAASEITTISDNSAPLIISNNQACKLLSFKIGGNTGVFNQDSTGVTVMVETGTDVTSLDPVLEVSADASYEPSGAQDFTDPLVYTITAQDGVSSRDYTVTVEVAKNTETTIESFMIGGYVGIVVDNTIAVNVLTGTNTAGLTPELTIAFGATYVANGNIYTVTAEDGETTQDYTLNIVEKAVAPQMAFIEGGTFTMGAGGAASTFEATISRDMFVSIFEVTWGQFSDLFGEARGNGACQWRFKPIGPTVPSQQMTWYDACDFCNALSEMHGLEPYYSITDRVEDSNSHLTSATVTINDPNGKGYRIPTEAEWEFIARGGNKSQGYQYPGSDIATEVGWVQANGIKTYNNWGSPFPGGMLNANELGIYDMLGNVREWCWDWFGDNYPALPTTDPMGTENGTNKCTRGGQFWASPGNGEMTVWERGLPWAPSTIRYDIGIRVVRNK